MILADAMIFWVGAAFLVGLIGFFVMLVAGLARVLAAVGRAVLGSPRSERRQVSLPPTPSRGGLCPNPACQQFNRPEARFCARCGGRLAVGNADTATRGPNAASTRDTNHNESARQVDAYG